EAGALAQHAKSEAEVAQRAFQPGQAVHVATVFLHLLHAPEGDERLASCLFRPHPGFQVDGNLLFDMEAEFVVELLLGAGSKPPYCRPKPAYGVHPDLLMRSAGPAGWRRRAVSTPGSPLPTGGGRPGCGN